MEVFRLHWLDGKVEIVRGEGIANAFNKAGYGGGAIRALDYYEEEVVMEALKEHVGREEDV